MKTYWRLKDVPELHGLTARERRRVHQECLRRHFNSARVTRRSLAAFFVLGLTLFISMFAGMRIPDLIHATAPPSYLTNWDFLVLTVSAAVMTTIGFSIGRFLFSAIAIPALRPFYGELIEG
jgi:hypothetical protein